MKATGRGKGHLVIDGIHTSELNKTRKGNVQIIHNKDQEYHLEIVTKQDGTFDVKHISLSFIKRVDKLLFANIKNLQLHLGPISQNRLREIASGQEMTEAEAIEILEFIRTKQHATYQDQISAQPITTKEQAILLLEHFNQIPNKVFNNVPPEKWNYQGEGILTENGFTFHGNGTYVKNMDYGKKRIYTGQRE